MLVNGFHLPGTNTFHFQIPAFTKQADVEILRIIDMPAYRGLAIVGKDLDQVLINKYAQGEVLPFLEFERRIDVIDGQGLLPLAGSNGKALVAISVTCLLYTSDAADE